MKTRHLFQISLAATLLAFAGCSTFIKNATPQKIEANASDIYTFRVKVDESLRKVMPKSMRVDIVINGETHPMVPDRAAGKYIWMYDCPIPSNVSDIDYYFIAKYYLDDSPSRTPKIEYSSDFLKSHNTYSSIITNRYVIKVASSRSPVGATIAVVGQGFTDGDKIVVGDIEAETSIVSHNHMNFIVPRLAAGQAYEVKLRTQDGDLSGGKIFIDKSTVGVQPNVISMKVGESIPVTFFVDAPAPAGGLTINVQTDIGSSIVMPVVVIPEGQRSVSVTLQASSAADGVLIIDTDGFEKAKVPVTIQ
jgi:hypothetical protein